MYLRRTPRCYALHILFAVCSCTSIAQNDSVTTQSKTREKNIQNPVTIPAFDIFLSGGAGIGGNDPQSGFARAANMRVHYKMHTLCGMMSWTTRKEGEPQTETLRSKWGGITYGFGIYNKNSFLSVGAGMGWLQTYEFRPLNLGGRSVFVNYNTTGLCISAQLGLHGKYGGASLQTYSVKSSSIMNYVALLGLDFIPCALFRKTKQ